jgi:hypothetical protein
MTRALADTGHLLASAVRGVREPHLWLPASVALLPILFLQVTFGDFLRSRLSPSIWTVISGSLLILWMTQTAAAASWGWVDACRHRRRVQWGALGRRAADVGTKTTLGLLAGVLPGLWWQARLAFDPLQDGAARRRPDAAERWALLGLATATAVVSLLGQSLAAGLAETLGAITPAGIVDGRVQFTLNFAPHLLASVVAYAWTVFALTLQAVGVSIARGGVSAAARRSASAHRSPRQSESSTSFSAGPVNWIS